MTLLDLSSDLSAVITTVGTAEDARRLALSVLEQRLAACVQIEVVVSHFRWDGALREEGEHRVVCKTLPAAVPQLLSLLRALHPYDLPELAVQPLRTTTEYARWVQEEMAPQA